MSLTLNMKKIWHALYLTCFKIYPLTQKLFCFSMKIYHVLMRVLDKNDFGIYVVDVFFH